MATIGVSEPVGGAAVRVASFNIRTSHGRDGADRWWLRRGSCLEAIRGFDADLVGLQEVRPRQLRYLRRRLRSYAFLGDGRDRRGGGEHASVLVRTTAWTVESTETRWLSPTPSEPGSRGWDASLPRVATLARLRSGTTRLGVVNTHFDHRSADARENAAALLVDWLAAETDRPWIVLGDLNAGPRSAPLRVLTGAGYVDALPVGSLPVGSLPGDAGGTEHAFTGATDRTRIDFVLAGPGVGVSSAHIDHRRPGGRLPSDHWPVVADLVVPPGGAAHSER